MRPIRTFMFVPGHRQKFIDGLPKAAMDAAILDLEDSVPPAEKALARATTVAAIDALGASNRLYVRVNKSAHLYSYEDLMAVVRPGLEGICMAMPTGPEDVALLAALLGEAEERNGVPHATVRILPCLETPRSLQLAYEIAQHPRVDYLMGAFAKGADLARALGLEWTAEGREALYLKSRVVMAARAAGKIPVGGIWQQVHDLDGLERYCAAERALGMAGTTILHPANAPVANRIFSPSDEELAHYRAMIAAHDDAIAAGLGSVMFAGEHIDKAHADTARAIVAAHDGR